jgi:HEPN domain-containing protein
MPEYEAWLKKALSDLKMAQKGLRDDDETLDCVVYHTYQCAEKAFKSFYVFNGKAVDRTHDLEYLLKICCDFDLDFLSLKTYIKKLNPFAVLSRYPDDRFCVDRMEAEEAIKLAKKVFDFVKMKIETPDPNMKLF